jgi:secondary thiamine-phosphate synthase enzyme
MGLALSRFAGCWTALKLSADIAEAAASVTFDAPPPQLPDDFTPPPDGLHIRWPDRALDQEARLQGPKMLAAQAFVRANGLDRISGTAEAKRGLVASGKAWGDLQQALADLGLGEAPLRLYKVALVWPLEPEQLLDFADGLDEILVVEEKRPLIEDQMRQALYDAERRPKISGKNLLPSSGELTPQIVARALRAWLGLPSELDAKAPRDKPLLRRSSASASASDEGGLHQDYARWLEELAPHAPTSRYLHNRTGEDNGDAHIKRQVMGREVVVAVTDGKLDFGPWEQIFYGEFDGRRPKRVLVKIIGE